MKKSDLSPFSGGLLFLEKTMIKLKSELGKIQFRVFG